MKRDMDTTRRDFLIAIARHYYIEDLSQREIADRYHISRSNVSKLLKACKEQNIVEIRIQSPSSQAVEIKGRLIDAFGLTDAVIAPTGADLEATKIEAARAGAAYLKSVVADNMRIGISWGTTLHKLVQEFTAPEVQGVEVIQFHGGFGATNPEIDGHELAGILARKLSGTYRVIHAPALVKNKELRDMLLSEPHVSGTIEAAGTVDIGLMGVGSNRSDISSMVRAGYLTTEESDQLARDGAIGILCGHHFSQTGELLSLPIDDRFVGISAETLTGIPRRMGIAVGQQKVPTILAALNGQLINILVTDEQTATGILYLKDSEH
jgi:deoxyribonucleoside regulator